jgi:starch phosphorylase
MVLCTSLERLKHCKNGSFSFTVASMSRLRRWRGRFEALARSVRDVLSQRRLLAEKAYEEKNPKRLYYLSMGFSSVVARKQRWNLLFSPLTDQFIQDKKLNLIGTL